MATNARLALSEVVENCGLNPRLDGTSSLVELVAYGLDCHDQGKEFTASSYAFCHWMGKRAYQKMLRDCRKALQDACIECTPIAFVRDCIDNCTTTPEEDDIRSLNIEDTWKGTWR